MRKEYTIKPETFDGRLYYACYDRYIVFCGHDEEGNGKAFSRRLYKGESENQYFFTFQGVKWRVFRKSENSNVLRDLH